MKTEIETEINGPIKVKVKTWLDDLSQEGVQQFVAKVQTIQESFCEASGNINTDHGSAEEFPQLSLGKNSVTEGISALIVAGYFNVPRLSLEVKRCLEVNTVFSSIQQVSDRLLKMTKQGLLKRIPSEQGYKYAKGVKAPSANIF